MEARDPRDWQRVHVKVPGVGAPLGAHLDPRGPVATLTERQARERGRLLYPHESKRRRAQLAPAGQYVALVVDHLDLRGEPTETHGWSGWRVVPAAWLRGPR